MSKTIYLGKNIMKIEQRLNELEEQRFESREPAWVSLNPEIKNITRARLNSLLKSLRLTRFEMGFKGVHAWKKKNKKDRLSVW